MLQKIREKSTGILGLILLGLISLTFALFGVQNYFLGSTVTDVAVVGDEKISFEDFQARLSQERQRMANNGQDTSVASTLVFQRQLLESMVNEALWRQGAEEAGLVISIDEVRDAIRSEPAFQVGGEFNQDAYLSTLRLAGMSPDALESDIRQRGMSRRIQGLLFSSGLVTDNEVQDMLRLQNQERTFDYISVSSAAFRDEIDVADEEISDYYEANSADYQTPEQVTIEYIQLSADRFRDEVEVTEDELRQIFEDTKTNYQVPERRLTSHILLEVAADADDDAREDVMARASDLAERARAGEDFAELAKEYSDDFSATDGGDLGWVERGMMVDPFEDALFDLENGAISDPVESGFGIHVIQLRDVEEARGKTFEEARPELAEQYRNTAAEREFLDAQAELESMLLYGDIEASEADGEVLDEMQAAASAFDLEVLTAGPFSRSGGEGITDSRPVIDAAFAEEALYDGLISDAVAVDDDNIVFLRVIDHTLPAVKPLEEVREQVRSALLTERANARARERAEEIVDQAEKGQPLAEIAQASEDLELATAESVTRSGGGGHNFLLVREVFSLPPLTEGEDAIHLVEVGSSLFAIVNLKSIDEPAMDEVEEAQRTQAESRLRQSYLVAELEALEAALRNRIEVTINESLLADQ